MHGAGAGILRQRHRQHLNEYARDVIFGLLFGQTERVDLYAVAEQPLLGVSGDAVGVSRVISSHNSTKARISHISRDEAQAIEDKKRNAPDHLGKFFFV